MQYKTVLKTAVAEYEEKKSRFIATVMPVSKEEDASAFISGLKTKYWDATHNVYAYYIVGNNTVQRYSDDGEPSGTAGMPVLEGIRRMELQDVAVVVTRYFGGTLLGAAGLIRAYGKAASLGIEAAGIVRNQLCREMTLMMEYPLLGKVQNHLSNSGGVVRDMTYGQDVEIRVYIPLEQEKAFSSDLVEATNARIIIEPGEKAYIMVNKDGKLVY